ncbi:MAG: LON peptidase substrate-binding domain-containing protein [Thaumarchaeota archaeon]|nr:LON peptidase substrate-binding domain-containing protein [Nitrososphaerota archaeon]
MFGRNDTADSDTTSPDTMNLDDSHPNQKRIIPIFPIDLVFFPRQDMPFGVIEPRYKQLVDDCMINDGQFGVCLIDVYNSIKGWNAPLQVGTIAKIMSCKDVGLDGRLELKIVGRGRFKIDKIIPPAFDMPPDYDPHTPEGHQDVSERHEKVGLGQKMYIQAHVSLIPEIDEAVPINKWEEIVAMWKEKVVAQALPKIVEPSALNRVLEQYYLATETPTIDYIYSLSALGANRPEDLQPLLEANTMDELISRVKELMAARRSD